MGNFDAVDGYIYESKKENSRIEKNIRLINREFKQLYHDRNASVYNSQDKSGYTKLYTEYVVDRLAKLI